MKEKSQIEDIDRSVYDIRDKEDDAYRMQEGLTPEIIGLTGITDAMLADFFLLFEALKIVFYLYVGD